MKSEWEKVALGAQANRHEAEGTCSFESQTQHITHWTSAGFSNVMDIYVDNKSVQPQRH